MSDDDARILALDATPLNIDFTQSPEIMSQKSTLFSGETEMISLQLLETTIDEIGLSLAERTRMQRPLVVFQILMVPLNAQDAILPDCSKKTI